MDKKVVVVTGASSGIGAMISKKLGRLGYCVVLASRRLNELNKTAKEAGENSLVVVTDVTKSSDVENLKKEALNKFGQIDIWINNAGRGISKAAADLTEEDLDEMISINLKSVLFGIQAVIPYFKQKNKGHLINIFSYLGRVPLSANRSAYNAAKAAVNSLTANLRMDLKKAHPDIKVSLVMPGMVLTDFSKNALYGTSQSPSPSSSRMKPQTAEDVADAIIELIKNPKAEIYTNPAAAEIAKKYYENIEAFEDSMIKG